MLYAIKLNNTFQDAYNEQHANGLLTEYDVSGGIHDDRKSIKTFETKEQAENAIEGLIFNDSPTLEVVEIQY